MVGSETTSGGSTSLTIGYWNIRGLGAPLRMMAEFAGEPYHAKLFDSSNDEWATYKAELIKINPFANLPFVRDGDRVITQSNACMSYLGTKFGLLGKDDEERAQVEQCLCQVMDLRNDAVALFYGKQIAHPFTDAELYRELLPPAPRPPPILAVTNNASNALTRSASGRAMCVFSNRDCYTSLYQAGGLVVSERHAISCGNLSDCTRLSSL